MKCNTCPNILDKDEEWAGQCWECVRKNLIKGEIMEILDAYILTPEQKKQILMEALQ